MHRSVAGSAGLALLTVGMLTQNIPALLIQVIGGLLLLTVAITGKPTPRLSLWQEAALLVLFIAVVVVAIAIGAYIIE